MVDHAKCFMAFFFVLLGPLEGRNILLGPFDGTNMMGIPFAILMLTLNRFQIDRAMIISSPIASLDDGVSYLSVHQSKMWKLFWFGYITRLAYRRFTLCSCFLFFRRDACVLRVTCVICSQVVVYVVHVGHVRRDLFAFFLVCFVHVGRTCLCFGRDIRVLRVACVTWFQVVVLCIACVTCLCGGYLLIGHN